MHRSGESNQLVDFYAVLTRGTTVADFLVKYERVIQFVHEKGLTRMYRLAHEPVKKLCDEVTPVTRFVRTYSAAEDWIWFSLSDASPDCFVRHEGARLREIEVTVAQGLERLNVMTELNDTGIGRGHLGLSDDDPKQDFVQKMSQPRTAYTESEIGHSMIRAVEICARKKSQHRGDTLLIEAPLETLPANRWGNFQASMAENVKSLMFSEVYITGRSDHEICLQIK